MTNIRKEKIKTFNELIAVTRDSAEFYDDASRQARNPQLQSLFKDMADAKNGLVGAMSKEVQLEGGKPDDDGTFRGNLHRLYGDVRGKIGSDDYGYVAQLEESEDHMLHAFNDALEDDDTPAQVKTVVGKYLPTVKQQHDKMRDRKWAMEAAKH